MSTEAETRENARRNIEKYGIPRGIGLPEAPPKPTGRDALKRLLDDQVCGCGHRYAQHDPEDGDCESGALGGGLDRCLCCTFHSPDPNLTTNEYRIDALLAHRSDLLALLGPLSDEELATVAEQVGWRDGNGDILPMEIPVFASLTMRRRSCELERENDDLHDDLVKCLEVRGLALEEAATLVQPGPDGQDYIDRARLIAQWITTAYERHAEGERSGHKAWVETEMARRASRVGVSPERTDDE